MAERIVLGSESQHFESVRVLTGIQRVVHDLHVGLVDRLTTIGVDVVPLHTADRPRDVGYSTLPDLADDPVLDQRPRRPEEVDGVLLLDVNMSMDLGSLFRSRSARRRPVIAIIYDVIPLKRRDSFDPELSAAFRVYLQQVLHFADHVVVTSHVVADHLRALQWRVKARIHVLPLGSTFSPRAPDPKPDDRLSMLYVSTIEPRKGHSELIEAFDILRRQGLDVDLTIAGRLGWQMGDFMQNLRQHPDFGSRLRWLDSPTDLVLKTEAKRCSIGVFPSADEGFGLFIEEGLALGLKMVASDIPVFREREQSNLFFSERDPMSLAETILVAHRTPWQEPASPTRLMADFIDDFVDLVCDVIDVPAGRMNARE